MSDRDSDKPISSNPVLALRELVVSGRTGAGNAAYWRRLMGLPGSGEVPDFEVMRLALLVMEDLVERSTVACAKAGWQWQGKSPAERFSGDEVFASSRKNGSNHVDAWFDFVQSLEMSNAALLVSHSGLCAPVDRSTATAFLEELVLLEELLTGDDVPPDALATAYEVLRGVISARHLVVLSISRHHWYAANPVLVGLSGSAFSGALKFEAHGWKAGASSLLNIALMGTGLLLPPVGVALTAIGAGREVVEITAVTKRWKRLRALPSPTSNRTLALASGESDLTEEE